MIYILIEENYKENSRYLKLLDGINLIAKKKHAEVSVFQIKEEAGVVN